MDFFMLDLRDHGPWLFYLGRQIWVKAVAYVALA
jgi:hypothetical protein